LIYATTTLLLLFFGNIEFEEKKEKNYLKIGGVGGLHHLVMEMVGVTVGRG
jgi:hypothetical protein